MITVTINAESTQAAIRQIVAKLADTAPLMDSIGQAMVASTLLRFRSGKGPDGQPWKPLSPITHLIRRGRGGKPLLDTGRLRNSITHRAAKKSVKVGTNVCYAAVHQFGAEIHARPGSAGSNRCGPRVGANYLRFGRGSTWARVKKVTIPARPFLGVSKSDQTEIAKVVADYLKG